MKDYSKFTDQEILDIIDPIKNKGAIPLGAVQESQKRKLKKYSKKGFTS